MRRSRRSEAALRRHVAEVQERNRRIQAAAIRREEDEIRRAVGGCTVRITTGPVSLTVEIPAANTPET